MFTRSHSRKSGARRIHPSSISDSLRHGVAENERIPQKTIESSPVFSKKDAIGNLMQPQKFHPKTGGRFFRHVEGQDEVGRRL